MTAVRATLAVVVGALIAVVLPDYIGLGIGFSSFGGHEDLPPKEAAEFAWLSIYSGGMALSLAALAVATLLSFTKTASRALSGGTCVATLALVLALLHIGVLYVGRSWLSAKTFDLFVERSEDHAWIVLTASLLSMIFFLISRNTAPSRLKRTPLNKE
jgi:hypothetical protein